MSASRRYPIDPWSLSPPTFDPVEAYLDVSTADPRVRRIVLFGARALVTNTPRGPIDLAIGCRALKRCEFGRLVRAASENARSLIILRAVNLNGTSEEVRVEVESTGRTIYDEAWGRLGSVQPLDDPHRHVLGR